MEGLWEGSLCALGAFWEPQGSPKPTKNHKKSLPGALREQNTRFFENCNTSHAKTPILQVWRDPQSTKITPKYRKMLNKMLMKKTLPIEKHFLTILCHFSRFWVPFGTLLGTKNRPKSPLAPQMVPKVAPGGPRRGPEGVLGSENTDFQ